MSTLITPHRARQLMKAYKPRGWSIIMGGTQQRGASGLCVYETRKIYVPLVCDDYSLYVYFHEVGHARLHRHTKKPDHECEYEAEMYAQKAIRDCGFRVSKEMYNSTKSYICGCICMDENEGIPIDPKIKAWAFRKSRSKARNRNRARN